MLDRITPIILTYNEEPNIGRTLTRLQWARDVLVVDSGSTDATLELVRRAPNARVLSRPFDDFASQWNYALAHGDVETPWVLAMDADYVLTPEIVDEMRALEPTPDVVGYRAHFTYCIDGRPLRGSLYPPTTVLFRRAGARFYPDGHCQRLDPGAGEVRELRGRIMHDDRKPMARWLRSQRRYARDEVAKLRSTPWQALSWPDRVRRVPFVAPPLAAAHALALRGCALDGRPGFVYAGQRALAELILSLELVRHRRADAGPAAE
jgi:glycosyltransferase involved in cell wall biosynthesis